MSDDILYFNEVVELSKTFIVPWFLRGLSMKRYHMIPAILIPYLYLLH